MSDDPYDWTKPQTGGPRIVSTVTFGSPIGPDARQKRHYVNVSNDLSGDVVVRSPPGAKACIYLREDGVTIDGICVYHETVDEKGQRYGHDNDYFFGPIQYHTDSFQWTRAPKSETEK